MKKVMRFLLVQFLILTIMIAMVSFLTVYAASNAYTLDELGLQVTIPDGYSVITRDTSASAAIFNKLGTSKSAIINHFKTNNIYLNAISDSYNEEIVVTNTENSLSNFSLLSDTVLNIFAQTLVKQCVDYGVNVSKYEIYQHSQAKFIKMHFTDTTKSVHGVQYYTIYDGKAMNFTMRSYEGSLSSRQETVIKKIVDSIKYDKAPPVAVQGEDTKSFIHTDTDSGVTFSVPANWKQEPFTKDREFIDVKFVSTKEDGCTMIYGSTDMWEQMSAHDKIGYTRSDINNSIFTKSEIAEMFNTTAEEISVETYNGIQYYKIEFTASKEAYGIDFSITMTQLAYISNGWIYLFQFSGTSTHKLYSDFEGVLNSVQYPTVSNVGGAGSANDTVSQNTSNKTDDSLGVMAVAVLPIIIGIIAVAVIVSRKKNTAPTTPNNDMPISDTPTPKRCDEIEPTISCENCGQALPADSTFCHICGTKIDKEI